MSKSLGLIGFGDFGKLVVRELSPHFDICVYNRSPISDDSVHSVDVKTALGQEVIILAIPAQFIERFLKDNRDDINPNALVVDVCSVKVIPEQLMKRYLPETCDIIASHPMFGPASAAKGVSGLKMMLYPSRISADRFEKVKKFIISELKLNIIEVTPEEHDKTMAYVQGLSHYIGRAMQMMNIPDTPLATKAYEDLYDMKLIQGHDSWELFRSIMHENPYAEQVNTEFKKVIQELDKKLKN